MLSTQENKKLTETDAGTVMGDYIRRYWMPFLQSADLPERDGEPVRMRLLGEDLLAFRASSGKVALTQQNCPHRWADLFYGRNEEEGIRCIYHGWKFGPDGQCVDMPTEADDSTFKDKVRIVAYPVREEAGILWTYMGPADLEPKHLPGFEWMRVPESHRYVSWSHQETNYQQAVEGGIDSAHSNFLHSTLDAYHRTEAWKAEGERSKNLRDMYHARDQHPKFFAQDTDYGVIIGARRDTGEDMFYWRYNLFLLPFYSMPPSSPKQKFFHAWTPIDDHNCQRWTFVWNLDKPLSASEIEKWEAGDGLHTAKIPGIAHMNVRNRGNDYLIDRNVQKKLTFTGIGGIGEQDLAVQEGMGRMTPRHREHLGTTDIGIIKARRRLLAEAAALQEGIEPTAPESPEYYSVRATDALLNPKDSWTDDVKIRELMHTTW